MKTLFLFTIFALTLLVGANHVKIPIPPVSICSAGEMEFRRESFLKHMPNNELAVSNFLEFVTSCISPTEDLFIENVTMKIQEPDGIEVTWHEGKNIASISRQLSVPSGAKPLRVKHPYIRPMFYVPEGMCMIYLPILVAGSEQERLSKIMIVTMRGTGSYALDIVPIYPDKHNMPGSRDLQGNTGYFMYMTETSAADLVGSVKKIYEEDVAIFGLDAEYMYTVDLPKSDLFDRRFTLRHMLHLYEEKHTW